MKELAIPGWLERETTQPHHMEVSLRYAAMYTPDVLRESRFAIPYHKQIHDEPYLLYLRRKKGVPPYEPSRFNLDIGQLEDDTFNSSGWVDFTARTDAPGTTPDKSRKPYVFGMIGRTVEVFGTNPYVSRPREQYDHYGLFVSKELRREGVATSLVTSARVILNQLKVKTLLIDEIGHMEEGAAEGDFYRSLNPYVFKTREWYEYYRYDKHEMGQVALPTAATRERPYVFL